MSKNLEIWIHQCLRAQQRLNFTDVAVAHGLVALLEEEVGRAGAEVVGVVVALVVAAAVVVLASHVSKSLTSKKSKCLPPSR